MWNHRHKIPSYSKGTCRLSPYCCHFNKFNGATVFAKMLPLEQKQTVRQMSLMRKTWPGKPALFSWYQENSVCYTLTPSRRSVNWLRALAGTGCSAVDTVFPLPLKSLCIIRRPQCSSAGSPSVQLLQGSFGCMKPDSEQRTQQGLGTAMYCSARCSAMHTHSLPFMLCFWQSLNLLLSLSASLTHACIIRIAFFPPLYSPHFWHRPFSSTLFSVFLSSLYFF